MNKRECVTKIVIFPLLLITVLLLTGCGTANSEANWDEGQGELSDETGNPDAVAEDFFAPSYSLFVDFSDEWPEYTDYDEQTGEWFDADQFGYGLSVGTMEKEDEYEVVLFGHDPDGVAMDRDIRIQLTKRDETYEQSELIKEDVVHADTISGEEQIYSNKLPEEENVVYFLSAEVLDEQGQVEDTMVSVIYVPKHEVNAKVATDQDVYNESDDEATLLLDNFGPTFLALGKSYSIEKKVNNAWKVVPLDLEFEDIGITLKPGDTYDQTIELDELDTGEYRVVKELNSDGSVIIDEMLGAEFIIE